MRGGESFNIAPIIGEYVTATLRENKETFRDYKCHRANCCEISCDLECSPLRMPKLWGPVPGSTCHLRRFLRLLTPLFFQPPVSREYPKVLVETSCKFRYRCPSPSPPPPLIWSHTITDVRVNEHDGTSCLAKSGKERCKLSYVTVRPTVF